MDPPLLRPPQHPPLVRRPPAPPPMMLCAPCPACRRGSPPGEDTGMTRAEAEVNHRGSSVIPDDGRGPRVLRRARWSRRPRRLRLLERVRSRCPASRRRWRAGARQDHGPDVRWRAPARATRDVPRRGRGNGHGHPSRRTGRDRDREVARLPRACRAERQEGRGGHGDQGIAGPAGGEGPAPGRSGPRAAGPAGLRRAEGAQQLRLPTAGGRGGLGWDPGGARRPGGRSGRRAHGCRGKRGASDGLGCVRCAARRHRRGSAPAGGVVAEVAERRPGRPQLRALGSGLEHGQRRPTGVSGCLQLPVGRALLRRGGAANGRRSPTSSWSTRTSTGRTSPAAGWCCPNTTWSSSTRPTSSRRS